MREKSYLRGHGIRCSLLPVVQEQERGEAQAPAEVQEENTSSMLLCRRRLSRRDTNKMPRGIYTRRAGMYPCLPRSERTRQKMREAHKGQIPWIKGKHHSETVRKKMSATRKGENASNWQGGKSFEPYSVDWTKTLKRAIRERDHYACQVCGEPQRDEALIVHHIDGNKKNCDPANLISVHRSCHGKHHSGKNKKQDDRIGV